MCANPWSCSLHYTFSSHFLSLNNIRSWAAWKKKALKSILYLTGRCWSVASPEVICRVGKQEEGFSGSAAAWSSNSRSPQKDKLQSSIPRKKDLHPTSCISRRERKFPPGTLLLMIMKMTVNLKACQKSPCFPLAAWLTICLASACCRLIGVTLWRSCSDPINMGSAFFAPNMNKLAAFHCAQSSGAKRKAEAEDTNTADSYAWQ